MLLQTGLIQRLTEQGKHVAIITPDAEDQNLRELKDNPRIQIFAAGISQTIWDDDYGVKRMYFLEDIKSNPVFWEKHLYSILYTDSKHPWKRIRPFVYYPIHRLIKIFPGIRRRFQRNEKKHLVDSRATDLIKKINPRLVVSTYPVNFLEAKFLYAAKKAGIGTLIHLLSWDNITSKGIFPVIPDHFIAWGPIMYEELKEYYQIEESQVQMVGVPHFDHHHKIMENPKTDELLLDLGLDPALPFIVFAMSAPRFVPLEIEIVEWLAKEVNAGNFGKDMQFIVRPHPQNVQGSLSDQSWINRLKNLTSKKVAVDFPKLANSKVRWSMKREDMDRLSSLLVGCSICMSSGSTVSIDALVVGKPIILTCFDADKQVYYWRSARRVADYPHQKKFIGLGGAKVTYSYEELRTAIHIYLQNPDADFQKRETALARECFKNDGRATERAVAAVVDVLGRLGG